MWHFLSLFGLKLWDCRHIAESEPLSDHKPDTHCGEKSNRCKTYSKLICGASRSAVVTPKS